MFYIALFMTIASIAMGNMTYDPNTCFRVFEKHKGRWAILFFSIAAYFGIIAVILGLLLMVNY